MYFQMLKHPFVQPENQDQTETSMTETKWIEKAKAGPPHLHSRTISLNKRNQTIAPFSRLKKPHNHNLKRKYPKTH
jgi:hypothetical protein